MLDANAIDRCPLTGTDVRNAYIILGPCLACIDGKIVEAAAPTSQHPPATRIGDNVSCDLLKLPTPSIGGNTQLIVFLDEFSKYLIVMGMQDKSARCICEAIINADSFYIRYGHKIRRLTPDAERCLIATEDVVGSHGILVTPTIPGRHSRRVERMIRTLRERVRTIEASLSFVHPDKLRAELYRHATDCINAVPNMTNNGQIPFQAFTGIRLDYESWTPYGRVAQCRVIKDPQPGQPKTRLGITLGPRPRTRDAVAVYLPSVNQVIVRHNRNVRLLVHNAAPAEWGWEQKIASPSHAVVPSYVPLEVQASNAVPHVQPTVVSDSTAETPLAPTVADEQGPSGLPTVIDADTPVDSIPSPPEPTDLSGDESDGDDNDEVNTPIAFVFVPNSPAYREKIRNISNKDSIDLPCFPITMEQALREEHAADVKPAVLDELSTIDKHKVWTAQAYDSLSESDIKGCIPSGLYMKYKTDADTGAYSKSKARMVQQHS
jgi:hypothetical protein